jgi:RNA polymerase sigma-70 factor (ECF subfamily)
MAGWEVNPDANTGGGRSIPGYVWETGGVMTALTDAELLDGLRHRDQRAFSLFFETYADRVYRLALHLLGSEVDADEVVQATFLSAFEAIDRFQPSAKISTWLYRIAYNHCLMLLRKRQPGEPLPTEDEALPVPSALVDWTMLPEAAVLSAEAQAILEEAISALSDPLRAAFVLRDIEQLSTAECAQVQGITESACKVRLHRARLWLRERLGEYFGEWVTTAHLQKEEQV